eukprot:357265-Chlamydomonas_euryale.AAC.6
MHRHTPRPAEIAVVTIEHVWPAEIAVVSIGHVKPAAIAVVNGGRVWPAEIAVVSCVFGRPREAVAKGRQWREYGRFLDETTLSSAVQEACKCTRLADRCPQFKR